MKKISCAILILIVPLLFATSCRKKEDKLNQSDFEKKQDYNPLNGLFTNDECVALFQLSSQKTYLPSNPSVMPSYYLFHGRISSPYYGAYKPVHRDGGDFIINSTTISKNDSIYRELDFSNASNFYGTTVTFQLTGNSSNGIDSFQRDLYIPEEIEMSSPSSFNLSKSVSQNTISWNTDQNYTGDVYIRILYKGTQSNLLDSTLSATDIVYSAQVPDNGTYLIPSSVFSAMPIGGIVELTIGRGDYVSINKSGKHFYILASTITSNIFDLVP